MPMGIENDRRAPAPCQSMSGRMQAQIMKRASGHARSRPRAMFRLPSPPGNASRGRDAEDSRVGAHDRPLSSRGPRAGLILGNSRQAGPVLTR